jgi:hypothetical protein
MPDDGVERVQLRVESPTVKESLYVCCNTVAFGVCDSVPVLKSVTKKRLVENVSGH